MSLKNVVLYNLRLEIPLFINLRSFFDKIKLPKMILIKI